MRDDLTPTNGGLPATTNGSGHYPAPASLDPALYSAGPESEQGGGLRRYFSAIVRYKWVVLLLTAVGVAGGILGSRYLPLEYEAEARMYFDIDDRNAQVRGPIQSGDLFQDYGWLELLQSYDVLDVAAVRSGEYLSYAPSDSLIFKNFELENQYYPGDYVVRLSADGSKLELQAENGPVIDAAKPGEELGANHQLNWVPPHQLMKPKQEVRFSLLTPRDAAKRIQNGLITNLTGRTAFLFLAYRSNDPVRAAAVVNAIIDRYVEVAGQLKTDKLVELRGILDTQLITAQHNLDQAELALESFEVQTITLPSEPTTALPAGVTATQQTVLNNFFSLRIEREQLMRDREAIERAIAATDSLTPDALSSIAAVRNAPELTQALGALSTRRSEYRDLGQTYLPEHLLMRRKADEVKQLETKTIPNLARKLMADLDQRARVVDSMIGAASTELKEIPPRAIEEARLRRTVASAENIYNDLRQRYEGVRLAAATTLPDVRILDRAAVPNRPVQDTRIRVILMAIAGSIAVALALAILLDRIDPRLQYPEQVTSGMRLPIVAAVPAIAGSRSGRALTKGADGALVVEALRGIRLGVMNAYGSAGPLILTISSPGPGDGKTFITSNLGLSFADLGKRVLLIDGDTRRGDLHRMFERSRKPGLTDFLDGSASLEQIIQNTRFPQVNLITSGSRIANAPELLASSRMGEILALARSRFDVVLFDSPPLGAGVDPLVLGTLAGSLLLVMRTGRTDRQLAESKLELIDRLPIRVLGVVLNGVPSGGSYRYYSYQAGYEIEAENADATPALQPG